MKWIAVVTVLCIAFTLRASGQQTTTITTDLCQCVPLLATAQSKLPDTLTPPVFAQVVFIGKQPDKDYCYKIETIRPNLELREPAQVTGRVTDIMGAPLMKSRLELRKYISQRKQSAVKVITTDEKGYFDLGMVAAGKYRFLASPHRGFKQPIDLKCPTGDKCELNIALQVNNPDTPISVCPVR